MKTPNTNPAPLNSGDEPTPNRHSTRRQFIKDSSIVMAAGALSGPLNIARAAHPFGDETIRLGLIGAGGRGTGAAAQAMNTAGPTRLVAVADAFEDRIKSCLRGLAREHGDKLDVPKERQFVGLDAYQQVLDSDIDLVIVATPPGFRPLHFEAAVAAGRHMFLEKPLAVDPAGVRRVLAANQQAIDKGLAVGVGLQRRHEDRYKETVRRIHDGMVGDIILARAYWDSDGVWVNPRQANQTEMEYQMRNWYYFNWLCGDHIVEQHIHNIDVINWIKQGYPVRAQGQGGREVRVGADHGEIFDHHFVEFTYEDGSKMFSQCRHMPGCWNAMGEMVHGSEGTANVSAATITGRDGKSWSYGGGGAGGHQQELHDLFAAVRKGEIPNEVDYGAMSTMTAILGRMATYSGQVIEMKDALASTLVVSPVDDFHSFDDTPPVLPDDQGMYAIPVPGVTQVIQLPGATEKAARATG